MYKQCKAILIISLLITNVAFATSKLSTPDIDDIEYPDEEEHSQSEIELGKTLFFDTRLSSNQKQSCATCHNPDLGFGDGLKTSLGTMGEHVGRNAPHLYNLAWGAIFFWDGRAATLEEQALGPIAAPGEMNLPLTELIPRLAKVDFYRKQFSDIYDDGLTLNNVGRAIAAFERTIISTNSPFDKYIAGDKSAMSPAAIAGMKLFEGKARCVKCHDGANFTDDSFHNIGVSDVAADQGRGGIIKSASFNGAFKTPGLRNTLLTAPYMHDGSEATLEDVIRFYNMGGKHKQNLSNLILPLNLTENEILELIAFLGALTAHVQIERPQIP
ncbi:cytochrome-c peroxidase [Algibacillus agarilyticus]|uniref:cytochrome-c peroxidase n=1 Tax=Algibacillus agarilyticus TaxID=2234133 RepID=UPI000DCF896D|nr:cytochrome c peroxidase [Algibacillus agarilyticus]